MGPAIGSLAFDLTNFSLLDIKWKGERPELREIIIQLLFRIGHTMQHCSQYCMQVLNCTVCPPCCMQYYFCNISHDNIALCVCLLQHCMQWCHITRSFQPIRFPCLHNLQHVSTPPNTIAHNVASCIRSFSTNTPQISRFTAKFEVCMSQHQNIKFGGSLNTGNAKRICMEK